MLCHCLAIMIVGALLGTVIESYSRGRVDNMFEFSCRGESLLRIVKSMKRPFADYFMKMCSGTVLNYYKILIVVFRLRF